VYNFSYISKNDNRVKKSYNTIIDILCEVQDLTRDKFTFSFTPVGSYSRNMITYDKKTNVGFDFDFNIEVNDDEEKFSAKQIKSILIDALNRVARRYGYSYAEDSTRVITIKKIDHFYSYVEYSCDFAIVNNYTDKGYSRQEYIHFNKKANQYYWCQQSKGYYKLPEKIQWLKTNNYWNELREHYIYKKNINTDKNIHSRTLFAIAVQEMCQKYGYKI